MKRVLVTGASGFVGAALARRLLLDGHEVHLALRPNYARWRVDGIADRVTIHHVEFSDGAALKALVRQIQPHWVFHLAVYGAYADQTDWRAMLQTNVLGTGNLLEACSGSGIEAFVNTGSSSEYGYKNFAPAEGEPLEPNSYYAITKAAATQLVQQISVEADVPAATLRLYSAFGPFEEPKRLVPTLLVNARSGRLPPLANPDIARDFVYVDDVCDAYVLAAESARSERLRGRVFNVATGSQTSLSQIVALTREMFSVQTEPSWATMAARAWDTDVWVGNPQRIRAELGWQPRHSLRDGLQAFSEWLRDNPDISALYESAIARAQTTS